MSQLLQCDGINDTDAFGVGPYFNGYGVLPDPDSDLELVLDSYETEVATSIQWVKEHKAALEGETCSISHRFRTSLHGKNPMAVRRIRLPAVVFGSWCLLFVVGCLLFFVVADGCF